MKDTIPVRGGKSRAIITHLIAKRHAAGLTQKQLAAKIKCRQSKISKMESKCDGALDLKDISDYAFAVGLQMRWEISE